MTLKKKLQRIFLTGLAVVVPAGLTIYILVFIIEIMDGLLGIIPEAYQPDTLLHYHIPGLGIIVTVLLIFICGLVTTSYFGHRMVAFGERIVGKIPIVRSIYQAIKKIADNLFMDRAESFKKVVIVEYPRRGVYSIGFITGTPNGDIQKCLDHEGDASGFSSLRPDAHDRGFHHGSPAGADRDLYVGGRGVHPDHLGGDRDAQGPAVPGPE